MGRCVVQHDGIFGSGSYRDGIPIESRRKERNSIDRQYERIFQATVGCRCYDNFGCSRALSDDGIVRDFSNERAARSQCYIFFSGIFGIEANIGRDGIA